MVAFIAKRCILRATPFLPPLATVKGGYGQVVVRGLVCCDVMGLQESFFWPKIRRKPRCHHREVVAAIPNPLLFATVSHQVGGWSVFYFCSVGVGVLFNRSSQKSHRHHEQPPAAIWWLCLCVWLLVCVSVC